MSVQSKAKVFVPVISYWRTHHSHDDLVKLAFLIPCCTVGRPKGALKMSLQFHLCQFMRSDFVLWMYIASFCHFGITPPDPKLDESRYRSSFTCRIVETQ